MYAPLFVQRVVIQNFRGIEHCALEFEQGVTLLVGRNNTGKSRILRALALSLGAVSAERDDLTVGGSIPSTIDIILAPLVAATEEDAFDVRVTRRLGDTHAVSEDPLRERFAWRTKIVPSLEGYGVKAESQVLTYDGGKGVWIAPGNSTNLNYEQRSLVVADLVETRRDLVEELTRRGSPIRRILDDLEITDVRRVELEKGLGALGREIVNASGSLDAVTSALAGLADRVGSIGRASLEPIPVRLEELARAVSIHLDTGNGGLPIRLHGAGSRSLASLQVQSVLYERRLGKDGPDLRPLPVSLVEEPEAHLHPQAQFELADVLRSIDGQVIVSTHSTHLVSTMDPRTIRVLQPQGQRIKIVDLRPAAEESPDTPRARRASLHVTEMEKLRRMIERPFGELLFASAVIIGDGATERAFLPPLLRHALGTDAEGICVVDPGSMSSDYAAAIIKFAELLDIPWLLFSDSDSEGVVAAQKWDRDFGSGDGSKIVWVGKPGPFGTATEQALIDFDSQLCISACKSMGYSGNGTDLLAFMKKHKGAAGRLLAAELVSQFGQRQRIFDSPGYWPESVQQLLKQVMGMLNLAETKK